MSKRCCSFGSKQCATLIILKRFENVVNSLGWDAIGGKENNDLYEWYLWLKEMVK